jgi:hypothetical protein
VGDVPDIDVLDSTWICARPVEVATIVAEPSNWRRWWPRLDVVVDEWRGDKGVRWLVRPSERGRLAGSMELWLEQVFDGVVVHFFLRLDGADGRPVPRRRARRIEHRYRTEMKALFWSIGDQLDPGRLARVSGPRR